MNYKSLFNFSAASLIHHLESLGLCQIRCRACLSPFFKGDLAHPSVLPALSLCPQCQQALAAYTGNVCRLCRLPAVGNLCRNCQNEPPPWNGSACHGLYDGALRELVLRFKFAGELQIATLFAEFLCEAAKCLPNPDAIISVPQFPLRLRERGFNQAHEIAKRLAKLTGLRMEPFILERIRRTPPQEGLSAYERKQNLENAFRADPEAAGKIIWLVDDVVTTGSTCASAVKELLKTGAKAVYVLFVARTPIN